RALRTPAPALSAPRRPARGGPRPDRHPRLVGRRRPPGLAAPPRLARRRARRGRLHHGQGSVTSCSTPEEAARGNLREEYVRVVRVAIRDDQSVVAQVMNADSYPSAYEIETVMCSRSSDGWEAGSSGNSEMAFMPAND